MSALLVLPARADTYYVAPTGDDAAAGTSAEPFRTIEHGLGQLEPGDTLRLRGGTYFERPEITVSGTEQSPIVIEGEPGETAIIDSGVPEFRTPNNSDWELVDGATGEYRSVGSYDTRDARAFVAGVAGYENERVALVPYVDAAQFRATSETYVDGATPFYVGPGTFVDGDRIHIRLQKTQALRDAEQRYGAVFSDDVPDPRQHSILLSQAWATVRISGAHLVLRDLVVHHASRSVYLEPGARDLRFEGVTVWTGDSAIEANGPDIQNVTITGSRIYGDAPYWIFWSDMKDAPAPADLLRATSIDLHGGTHHWEISYNHIRGSGQDLVGTNSAEYEVAVHHNRLENCGDDAFELEGDMGRVEVYENYVGNCLVAVAPGQDSPGFQGPLLVYRNVFALLRPPPVNRDPSINDWNGNRRYGFEYLLKQHSGNTHYYQNTFLMLDSAGPGMNLVPAEPVDTVVANNILMMVNGRVNGSFDQAAGQTVDGDLYFKLNDVDTEPLLDSFDTVAAFSASTGLEPNGLGSVPKRGTDPEFESLPLAIVDSGATAWQLQPASEVLSPLDFFLAASSPARDAAVLLPTHPTVGTLPDTRSSADIGAIPYGTDPDEYDDFPFVPGGG
ncbi:MAG: hypothetical protein JRI23_32060, partial [Deltaproteobacteria bacterium]|nr:hypothetical protein [Deltaproteobacteria bacterium]MBW2536866.1 hypothetical protein [Deltaproteobacteria bacterium]